MNLFYTIKIIFLYLFRYLYIKHMKNLKITEEAHELIKKYCDKNFLKISEWISHEIIKLIKEKENDKNK